MIQSLPVKRSEWFLYWADFDIPTRVLHGEMILPTVLILIDEMNAPVAPPEISREIDQRMAETFLSRLFEENGRPERLTIGSSPDWDEAEWRGFAAEYQVKLRFRDLKNFGDLQMHASPFSFGQVLTQDDGNKSMAFELLQTAMKLRSVSRREAYLRKILTLDVQLSAAWIELMDLEFARGEWKIALKGYKTIQLREMEWILDHTQNWWEDLKTRPYLRALYGEGMTLWHQGKYGQAEAVFTKIIEANQKDHQGVRFFLPMLSLLSDSMETAANYFQWYEKTYPNDFEESGLHFGWGYVLTWAGDEGKAKHKYQIGMLRNIYLAPLLLETEMPPTTLWHPNDRAEYHYAEEFVDSYALLWEREPGALRLLREAWIELQPRVAELVVHRRKILDFQDQHYDADYRKKWDQLLEKDSQLMKLNACQT